MAYGWVQPIETVIEDWKARGRENQCIRFHISTSLFLKIIVISYNIHKDKYFKRVQVVPGI